MHLRRPQQDSLPGCLQPASSKGMQRGWNDRLEESAMPAASSTSTKRRLFGAHAMGLDSVVLDLFLHSLWQGEAGKEQR
jgi:hypothetical protein